MKGVRIAADAPARELGGFEREEVTGPLPHSTRWSADRRRLLAKPKDSTLPQRPLLLTGVPRPKRPSHEHDLHAGDELGEEGQQEGHVGQRPRSDEAHTLRMLRGGCGDALRHDDHAARPE